MKIQDEKKQTIGGVEETGESKPGSNCCSTSCCGGTGNKKNSNKEKSNGNS